MQRLNNLEVLNVQGGNLEPLKTIGVSALSSAIVFGIAQGVANKSALEGLKYAALCGAATGAVSGAVVGSWELVEHWRG